jgi:hypothetical protein
VIDGFVGLVPADITAAIMRAHLIYTASRLTRTQPGMRQHRAEHFRQSSRPCDVMADYKQPAVAGCKTLPHVLGGEIGGYNDFQ